MEIINPVQLSSLDSLIQRLDSCRVYILRLSLRSKLLRKIYSQGHSRLAAAFIFSTLVFLPLALLRPELLLALGPLIFGYPHLMASFRFTAFKSYGVYILATALAISLHLSKVGFLHIDQLPFGVWQVVVAAAAFIFIQVRDKKTNPLQIMACLLLSFSLIGFAWKEPLIYIGATLILHNWIAFTYWIITAKEKRRRWVAIGSSLVFLLIHVLVMNGSLDPWFPLKDGVLQFGQESQTTGWYLASWSSDPFVWYRLLVLYTFGLSMHYFVWLRAIPESLNHFEYPNNFRIILRNLRQEIGKNALIITTLVALSGTIFWLFSFSLGSAIYFEIALLHGSIELIFLVRKIIK